MDILLSISDKIIILDYWVSRDQDIDPDDPQPIDIAC